MPSPQNKSFNDSTVITCSIEKQHIGVNPPAFCGVTLHFRHNFVNKRPKGPHIVHLSTMCHLFGGLARAAILFFRSAQKNSNLVEGRWDLASCQVSLNSIQRFQRRSRKCLSQSEARVAILFFQSARKTQTWKRTLRSCFLSSFVEFRSAVSEEKSKMSQPIRGQGSHLVFSDRPEKTQTW